MAGARKLIMRDCASDSRIAVCIGQQQLVELESFLPMNRQHPLLPYKHPNNKELLFLL